MSSANWNIHVKNGRIGKHMFIIPAFIVSVLFMAPNAFAESEEELARKLTNPVAALISVPIQINYDSKVGAAESGSRYLINIQPVIPFDLNEEWNLISRTIMPVMKQNNIFPGTGNQSGIGDITQSLFFSPKLPTESGWVWAVGPVFSLPTATNASLGTEKWGLGPSALVLKLRGPLTYGLLTNHIWSVAGNSARQDISNTFLQPFLAYTTGSATTFSINSESTYDWEPKKWVVPINAGVAQMFKVGDQLVSVGGFVRYWAKTTAASPKGTGFRLQITLLFPK